MIQEDIRTKFLNITARVLPGPHFLEQVVDIWNTLPPSKVDFSSPVKFKRSLKLLDLSQYFLCT